MMHLSTEERIKLVELSQNQGWPYRQVAYEFNTRHPERPPIWFTTVGKIVCKFEETGAVLDRPRPGRPKFDNEKRHTVVAKCLAYPTDSLRRTALILDFYRETLRRILEAESFPPCKLQNLQKITTWRSPECHRLMPQLDMIGECLPEWFQQDGVPPHHSSVVKNWLNGNFPNWIGRGGRSN
jgi:transposase